MSTATGIEIATGASAQSPVAARSPAKTLRTGLATTDASSPAASFRSSWQSLLASLGSGLDEASEDASGPAAAQASAGTASVAGLNQTVVTTLSGGSGKKQGTRTLAAVAISSQTGSRSGPPALKSMLGINRQTASGLAEKGATKTSSAGSSSDTPSAKDSRHDTASTGTMEQVSAVPESPSQLLSASVQPESIATASGAAPVSEMAKLRASEDAPAMPFGLGDAAKGKTSLSASEISAADGQTANQVGESGLSGKASPASATEWALRPALRDAAPASESANSQATRSSQGAANPGVQSGTSDQSPAPIAASASSGNETVSLGRGEASLEQIPVRAGSENLLQSLPSSSNQAQSAGTETLAIAAGGDGLQAAAVAADTAKSQSSQSPAASSIGKKQGVASAGRTSEQITSRSTQLTGTVDPMQHNNLSTAGQSAVAAQNGAGLINGFAGGHGTIVTSGNTAGESAASAVSRDGSDSRETFSALDAGSTATPTWIHAGAQRAEAGFQDPALGWIGVRADSSGGSIHASLVAGSADAAQTLSGHLAGLNAYLADQHTPVGTVTMAATEDRSAPYGTDQTTNQDMNQGTGQDGGRGQQPVPADAVPAFTPAVSAVSAARTEVSIPGGSPGGAHISLIA